MERCDATQKISLFEYIGDEYAKCAYLYIDLVKYGFENKNVKTWIQRSSDGEIELLALKYYSGMHLFSKEGTFDAEDAANLIRTENPSLVCGMKDTIEQAQRYLDEEEYLHEYGKVVKLKNYTGISNDEVYRASREEIGEIVDLLMTDEEMGGPYTRSTLFNQFIERYDQGFGRSWVRRDEKGIISHCATYAETDNLAVISGGIVRKDYRGKGEYP